MNVNKSAVFWGIVLIGGGVLALAQQLGFLGQFSSQIWAMVFASISLLGLIGYALSGWKQWGLLFPTGIFGGLAVTVWLAMSGNESAAVGSPLFIGLTIPFVASFLTDRARNW